MLSGAQAFTNTCARLSDYSGFKRVSNRRRVARLRLRLEEIIAFKRDAKAEGATVARLAFDPCVAAVTLSDTANDEQAEASAFDLAMFAAAQAAVALEQALLVILMDA